MIGINDGVKEFDDQMDHVVAIKGYKKENGKLMLHIRDSVRDRDNRTETWMENKMTNEPDKLNLALPLCMYFEFV